MDSRAHSVADAVREEQRLLLKQFIDVYDSVDATLPDDIVIERFLDEGGIEHRTALTRVEAELLPVVQLLIRFRGQGIPSAAANGIAVRIQTALSLLKGEQ